MSNLDDTCSPKYTSIMFHALTPDWHFLYHERVFLAREVRKHGGLPIIHYVWLFQSLLSLCTLRRPWWLYKAVWSLDLQLLMKITWEHPHPFICTMPKMEYKVVFAGVKTRANHANISVIFLSTIKFHLFIVDLNFPRRRRCFSKLPNPQRALYTWIESEQDVSCTSLWAIHLLNNRRG